MKPATYRTADGDEIEIIIPAEEIASRIGDIAKAIAERHPKNLLLIAILKGSFIFASDLIRALHTAGLAPEVDFVTLASYRDATRSSGRVEILRDFEVDVSGRDVLIVDDILESGRTLAFARELALTRGARRVETCVLLDKPVERASAVDATFKAFDCPDVFVVGYGMDLANRYRELPFVGNLVRRAGA